MARVKLEGANDLKGLMGAAYCAGKIVLAGGNTTGNVLIDSVFIYDIAGDSWTRGPSIAVALNGCALVPWRDSLVFRIAGINAANAMVNTVEYLDIKGGGSAWMACTPKTADWQKGGAVVLGDTIFILGGQTDGPTLLGTVQAGAIEPTDPTLINWNESYATLPEGHLDCFNSAEAMDNSLFLVGGSLDGTANITGRAWEYDRGAGSWTEMPTLPAGHTRWHYTAARVAPGKADISSIYVVAGDTIGSTATPSRSVWRYYRNTPSLAVELVSFAAQQGDNTIVITWNTASEHNCHKWIIERTTMPSAGFAPAATLDGHGSTAEPHEYRWADNGLTGPGTYYYRLTEIDLAGNKTMYGPVSATLGARLPASYELLQSFPNPVTRGAAAIRYALARPGQTRLTIYNIMGQEVRTLVDAPQKAGYYSVNWDGRIQSGKRAANGIYFYKLSSGTFSAIRKLAVVR